MSTSSVQRRSGKSERTLAIAALLAVFSTGCEGLLNGRESADASTSPPSDGAAGDDAALDRDAGPPPAGTVGVFVATGWVGRTMVSCDEGRTWVANQSMDDALRCYSMGETPDCNHHEGAAQGLAYGDGWFFAAFGWGTPGRIVRSRDGVRWEQVLAEPTFGGLDFGAGRLLASAAYPQISSDDGATFAPTGDAEIQDIVGWSVRHAEFVDHAGGRFVIVGDDGSQVAITSDFGATYWRPRVLDAECGRYISGIAYGNGTIIMVSSSGAVCRSTDGGETWARGEVGSTVESSVLWNGTSFEVWSPGAVHRSTDGARWTPTATSPAGVSIGAVARSESGAYVAVNAGWDRWYEQQQLYRSEDGARWEALPAGAFQPSHMIEHIAYGRVDANTTCR